MPFHVRDVETDLLVRKLSARTGKGLTDAVRMAVANELRRLDGEVPLRERIRPILDSIAAYPKIDDGMTDKEFWDDLSGDY